MPIKSVKFPDGSVRRIKVPEGATNEQIIEFARSVYQNGADARLPPMEEPAAPVWQPKRRTLTDIRAESRAKTAAEEMSGGERFGMGLAQSVRNNAIGAGQLLAEGGLAGQGAKAVAGALGIQAPRNPIADYLAGLVEGSQQADRELLDTGGGLAGSVVGNVAQLVVPGLAAVRGGAMATRAPALAHGLRTAFLPQTLKGAAAQGAVLGAIQPVGEGDSRVQNVAGGTVAGGAGAGLGWLLGRGINALRTPPAWSRRGANQAAADALRQEADDIASLVRPAPSGTPGYRRYLSEESRDAGIARLEQKLRGMTPGWAAQDRANNSAHIAALGTFAGDDAAFTAAEAARSRTAGPLLQQARKATGMDTSRLRSQLERLEKRYTGNETVQKAVGKIRELLGEHDSANVLMHVRESINRMLSGTFGGTESNALRGSRELIGIRNQLDRVLNKAQGFREGMDAFRNLSRPIDRMKAGRHLINRGGRSYVPDAVTGEPVLTPDAFWSRTHDLDQLAAQATGFRKAKAANIMEPSDLATIANIGDDLSRRKWAATRGTGVNSATDARAELGKRLGRNLMARVVPLWDKAAVYLESVGEQRMYAKLAEVLQNPQKARILLAAMPARDRKVLEAALARVGGLTGITGQRVVSE